MLRYFGLPEADFPNAIVGEQVAILDDHLESFLSDKWSEWGTACKHVEDESEVSLTKNSLAYRTATLKAEGDVPEMLIHILSKVKVKKP